jgi:putative addiction module component (TIGR02574 family)
LEKEHRMTDRAARLQEELRSLAPADRAALAHFLIDSLAAEGTGGDDETDNDSAWEAELARRAQQISEGAVVGRAADEVLAEMRAKYT